MQYKLTAEEVGELIELHPSFWPGNCSGVVNLMLRCKISRGKSRYGHFLVIVLSYF